MASPITKWREPKGPPRIHQASSVGPASSTSATAKSGTRARTTRQTLACRLSDMPQLFHQPDR